MIVSRAAATEGQCPVEYGGYFVRPLFRGPAIKVLAWGPWPGGPERGGTDVRMDKISPVLSGAAAQKGKIHRKKES